MAKKKKIKTKKVKKTKKSLKLVKKIKVKKLPRKKKKPTARQNLVFVHRTKIRTTRRSASQNLDSAHRTKIRTTRRSASRNLVFVHRTKIKVIGIGGGGNSIVSEIAPRIKKANSVVANTDLQALKEASRVCKRFHFGESLTSGLGCGMNSKLGEKAARNEKEKINDLIKEQDLCILVSCLGGGTGSGASPVFAEFSRELKNITLGIFTLPFKFEGTKKAKIARLALDKLIPNLNAVVIIPNEKIFQLVDKKTPLKEAFSAINERLIDGLEGLIEMIFLPGLINIDWSDFRTVLEGKEKLAYLNSAFAQGPNRAEEAVKKLLSSPLNEYSIKGADRILFNITASKDLGMKEVEQISKTIADFNPKAKIIFGISYNQKYRDKLRIVLLVVGCGKKEKLKHRPKPKPKPEPKLVSPPIEEKTEIEEAEKREVEERPEIEKPKLLPLKKKKIKNFFPKRKKSQKILLPPKKPFKKQAKSDSKALSLSVETKNSSSSLPARRNALELKKQAEEVEKEMIEEEKKWDVPTFIRKKLAK